MPSLVYRNERVKTVCDISSNFLSALVLAVVVMLYVGVIIYSATDGSVV